MKLPRFKYIRPANREAGLHVLQAYGRKAKILAGAHKNYGSSEEGCTACSKKGK